jgi:hypothetical protein
VGPIQTLPVRDQCRALEDARVSLVLGAPKLSGRFGSVKWAWVSSPTPGEVDRQDGPHVFSASSVGDAAMMGVRDHPGGNITAFSRGGEKPLGPVR